MVGLIPARGCLAALCLISVATAPGRAAGAEKRAFSLEKVPGLSEDHGHRCSCENEPDPNVVYPAFSSAKPLYGVIRVDMEWGNQQSGTPYHLAVDESGGTGTGYNRLYVDLNHDGRLSDESPLGPLQDRPDGLLHYGELAQDICFSYITLTGTRDGADLHSVQVLPRFILGTSGYAVLAFVATEARKGKIEIDGRSFDVTLVNGYPIGTRWDRPGTTVKLEPRSPGVYASYWLGADRLMAMHEIRGRYWRLSTTPAGDRLRVEPYTGDFGTLTVGSGGRFIWKKAMAGSLFATDRAVAVGYRPDGSEKAVRSCRIPVGQYLPAMLDIQYGPLLIEISENYHSDGQWRGRETPLVHTLDIRKDKPFVLDFSGKPEVLFASPAAGTSVKPGEELRIMAVLTDPKFDIMIRGLSRKSYERYERLSPGTTALFTIAIVGPLALWIFLARARRRYLLLPISSALALALLVGYLFLLHSVNVRMSAERGGRRGHRDLIPQVTICRADGRKVAEGAMPFG